MKAITPQGAVGSAALLYVSGLIRPQRGCRDISK
jgi:hypothetical protein